MIKWFQSNSKSAYRRNEMPSDVKSAYLKTVIVAVRVNYFWLFQVYQCMGTLVLANCQSSILRLSFSNKQVKGNCKLFVFMLSH